MGIYYFSGTGNSYYVAKQISEALNIPMRPIHIDGVINEAIPKDIDEYVGFIFPIYDFKAPPDMIQQMKQIPRGENAYVFAVATYGVGTLGAYAKLCKELTSAEKTMDGGFGVMMPHNAVGSQKLSDEDIAEMLFKSEETIGAVIDKIKHKRRGDDMTTNGFQLLKGNILKMVPAIGTLLYQLIFHGVDSLKFQTDERCISCGKCVQICPVNNITMIDGRPHWGDHCLGCFGCLQWCEQRTITFGGKTLGVKPYTHPKVTFEEMKGK